MAADRPPTKDELTAQLSAMFKQIQSQAVPDRIISMVDQLDGQTQTQSETDLTPASAAPRAAIAG
ncbi:hypothetical protein [Phenylobacterium sp.]|uniref:hypothetical protein n=1 Tax=Phenylobacterium sp. TaxID=1871053 RepID=UPI003003860E